MSANKIVVAGKRSEKEDRKAVLGEASRKHAVNESFFRSDQAVPFARTRDGFCIEYPNTIVALNLHRVSIIEEGFKL